MTEKTMEWSGVWLPIDTAPNDATVIDLWRPTFGGERLTDMRRVDLGNGNIFYEPVESGPSCVRDASHWMPKPVAPGNEAAAGTSDSQQSWGTGQFAVVATFRYCLGRQTYIVQECADWLLHHWPAIDQPVRNLVQRELERAFEQDDKARAGDAHGYKPLGWDCDREQWERVRSLWANV